MRLHSLCALTGLLLAANAQAQNAIAVSSLQGYGSFETAGVWVTFSGDANANAQFSLTVKGPADAAPRPVHPPARFDATHAATSIFGLQPDTDYTVALTTADPDGVTGGTQSITVHTRKELALPAPLRDVYVSPSGDDGNAGDAAHPFATIQHAVDQAQPGDAIHIAAGVYREQVTVSTSGTADHPIALLGEPGAILDGADPTLESGGGTWSGSGPVYSTPFSANAEYAAFDGTRMWHQQDATLCPLTAAPTHAPGEWCISGGTLYLALSSGAPEGHAVQVPVLNTGIDLESANHVWIQGLEVRFYGAGDYGKGIFLHASSDDVVTGNVVHNDSANIWLKLGDHDVFQDNDSYDTGISAWPWADVKHHDEESTGIYISDAVGVGNVIRGNHVHGTFDGIDFCGDSAAATTTENDVYDNLIDDHLDDGSEADGACINARMFRNTFRDTHMGISLAPASPGPLFIVRNVILRYGGRDGTDYSAPFKFNNGYAQVTENVFAYHNTAISADAFAGGGSDPQPGMWLGQPGHARGVTFADNILVGSAYALEASNDTDVQLSMDYDDLFTTDSTRYVRWWDGSAVQHYPDIASFSAATGEEVHGIAAMPSFVDLASGDLRPAPGSPVIDKGIHIPGIDDDYAGSAPDLGAFEAGSPAPDAGWNGAAASTGTSGAPGGSSGSSTSTSNGSGTGTGTSGTSGAAGSTGSASASGTAGGSTGATAGTASGGCGCSSGGSPAEALLFAFGCAFVLARRRRTP